MSRNNVSAFFVAVFYVMLGISVFKWLLFGDGYWLYGDANFPINDLTMKHIWNMTFTTWWGHEFNGYDTLLLSILRMSFTLYLQLIWSLFGSYNTAEFFFI
jgi:hypothetical protein